MVDIQQGRMKMANYLDRMKTFHWLDVQILKGKDLGCSFGS